MAKFKIGDRVRIFEDCVTIFTVTNIYETHVNYFYDLKSDKFLLEKRPEQELSLVEEEEYQE